MVDPSHQIAVGDIANEQEQAVSRLIEPAVAQIMTGNRAARDVFGLRALAGQFLIATLVETPEPAELRALRPSSDGGFDLGPGDAAVFAQILLGETISDALVTQDRHQPIEQRWGVVTTHRR